MRVTKSLSLINNIGSGLKFVEVVKNDYSICNSSNDPKRFLILSDLIVLDKFVVAGSNASTMSNVIKLMNFLWANLASYIKMNTLISDFIVFNGLKDDKFAVCIIIELKAQSSIEIDKVFASAFVNISKYTNSGNFRLYSITDYKECLKHCFNILRISSEPTYQPVHLKKFNLQSPSFFRSYKSFYDIYDQLYKQVI